MKRLAGLSALALIISTTSGCGWLWGDEGYFRDRSTDYLDARQTCLLYTSPSPRDLSTSRMPSSA